MMASAVTIPSSRTLEKGRRDENSVHEIVESVADQDQQTGTSMIVGRRLRVMRFAMVVVAMAPQHQFFQHEESQDAEQDRRRHAVRIAVLERVRQDLEKSRAEKGTDRIGNQHIDMVRADRDGQRRRGGHAQHATGQRNGDDPGKGTHGHNRI